MMPDLPMPVRMTRPRHCLSNSTEHSNLRSSRPTRARIAAASVSSTFRASDRSTMDAGLCLLHDVIDRAQAVKERLEELQAERVLRVAFRARWLLVHLEEHAVDACCDTGRRSG